MPKLRLSTTELEVRDFSDWVRGQLSYKGLRQQDLADELGITQVAVSLKLKMKNAWSLSDMAKCCEFFGEAYTVGRRV